MLMVAAVAGDWGVAVHDRHAVAGPRTIVTLYASAGADGGSVRGFQPLAAVLVLVAAAGRSCGNSRLLKKRLRLARKRLVPG
ncbi:MAG: hypothetical protein Tsb0027_19980 [Wenzhouxiangellaceae bacterium]